MNNPVTIAMAGLETQQVGRMTRVFRKGTGETLYVGGADVQFIDDFLGDLILDEWTAITGSDGNCVAAAISAGVNGGVISITSGADATPTTAECTAGLTLGRNFRADKGGLICEWRVALTTAVTQLGIFCGLTDTIALEEAFSLSGTTLTSTATDAIGFLYDTDATTDYWHQVGVAADVDKPTGGTIAPSSLLAPTADTYDILTLCVDQAGVGNFYVNGVTLVEGITGLPTTVLLSPTLHITTRDNSDAACTVDYCKVWACRQ